MKKVLIIDDHGLFSAGIALLVERHFPDAQCLAMPSAEQALDHPGDAPDLILLDIQLDGIDGLVALPLLRARWPVARIVLVSADPDRAQVAIGEADAVLAKSETPERMVAAIRALIGPPLRPEDVVLTAHQALILGKIAEGLPNKAIARQLGLSEFTVRGHVQTIMRKLGVNSRTAAAHVAHERHLI